MLGFRALLGLYNSRGVGGPARLCRDQVGQPPGVHWFESCLSSPPWRLWGGSGVISAESTITHGAPALPLLGFPGLGLAEHHGGSGTVLGAGAGWKTQELPSGHSCVMETSMGRRSSEEGTALGQILEDEKEASRPGRGAVSSNPSPQKPAKAKARSQPFSHSINPGSSDCRQPGSMVLVLDMRTQSWVRCPGLPTGTSCPVLETQSQWFRPRPPRACGMSVVSHPRGCSGACRQAGVRAVLPAEQRAQLRCLRPWQRSSLQPRQPQSRCSEPRPSPEGPGSSGYQRPLSWPQLPHCSLTTLSVSETTEGPRGFLCGSHLSTFSTLKVKTEKLKMHINPF